VGPRAGLDAVVPMSRMRGDILPLPNTPSWRDAQLKHRDNFTFILMVRTRCGLEFKKVLLLDYFLREQSQCTALCSHVPGQLQTSHHSTC
jgi:hypothetical protein